MGRRISCASVGSGSRAFSAARWLNRPARTNAPRRSRSADVVLVEQDDHLVRVALEEPSGSAEEVDHPRRAELAQRVAQPDVALGPRASRDRAPGSAAGARVAPRAQLRRDSVDGSRLRRDVGVHPSARVGGRVVRRDLEQPDSVLELLADLAVLVGDQPPGESAADIELCVPANTTSSSRRSHSCA